MNPIAAHTRRIAHPLQHALWVHPEWWSVALSGGAWLAMTVRWREASGGLSHPASITHELAYWFGSVVAMMLPLSLDAVRATADGSLWVRRHRAVAGFLLGFFAPWMALGMLAIGVSVAAGMHSYAVAALGFAGAAVWQQTTVYKRAVVACHRRVPLAPFGWSADRDCLRFGGTIGLACVQSCWPVMLACAFAGHGMVAMAGGLAIGVAERWWFRPRVRAMLWTSVAIASYYGVLAGLARLSR